MKSAQRILLIAGMLLGLPLAGVWLSGQGLSAYLQFPPRTQYVAHAPFSWPVFVVLALLILGITLPFLIRIARSVLPRSRTSATWTATNRVAEIQDLGFPWWGWLALALGGHCWILAWSRQAWFEPYQLYTFTPQWLCYIVTLNALTWRRSGRCLLTHNTKFLLWLFPVSAVFWWFFEYLNRFVQNWYYIACEDFTPLQYAAAATLSFSTVLPAVLSTEEWLASYPRSSAGLHRFIPIRISKPKPAARLLLALSAAGLFFIGWFPDQLFPLLWVAPLLLLMAFNALGGGSFFPEIQTGDWRRVYRFCLAALICGFFWELWNWHSLAKWVYSVPYVARFHLFEMPILGYSGYLPFGLECAVVAELVRRRL
ncbi:MAG: hypothetical protein KJN98_03095 [Pontiella sp.]|nr:hypothetical protein [Pontiella sp.]